MPIFRILNRQLFAKDDFGSYTSRKAVSYGIVSATLCLLLTACAGLKPEPAAPAGMLPVSCAGDMSLNGRFSMHYSRNGNDEAVHGGFLWNQVGSHTEVRLLSPLGQTLATINVTPDSAVLVQSGRPPRTATDPDELAAVELGWPLPVSGMQSWLRGCALASDGRVFIASEPSGSIATQDGWLIRYVGWQTDTSGRRRPKRIDLDRTGSPAGDISIRLVIDTWQPSTRP